jgi:hypothetical protein
MLPKKQSPKTPPSFGGGDKNKKAAIPVWGTTGKDKVTGLPMFRAPGFAGSGTIISRVKNLKTKDLAFITAGLAVLVMAPLAEYMISSPDDQSGVLREGFDQKGGLFPDGSSPYENGVAGIAPGGLMGQDSDVITPLNVRDPSSLIMSPGGKRTPPAAPTASPALPKKPKSGWKDAIAAAKRGATKAVKKAGGLPRPNAKLKGALKDWRSTVSGASRGGGPTARLTAPSSKGLFSGPRVANSLTRAQGLPGLNGGRRSTTGGGSRPDLYGGGRYGGAGTSGTGVAANTFGPGGVNGNGFGPGSGGPGSQKSGKGPGASSTKDSRSLGESLAFLRAKKEMDKAIDLKWKKKEYNELGRKKMLEKTAVQTAQQAFMKVLEKLLEKPEAAKAGSPSGSPSGTPPGGKPDQKRTDTRAPSTSPRPPGEREGESQIVEVEALSPAAHTNLKIGQTAQNELSNTLIQIHRGTKEDGDPPKVKDAVKGKPAEQKIEIAKIAPADPESKINAALTPGKEAVAGVKTNLEGINAPDVADLAGHVGPDTMTLANGAKGKLGAAITEGRKQAEIAVTAADQAVAALALTVTADTAAGTTMKDPLATTADAGIATIQGVGATTTAHEAAENDTGRQEAVDDAATAIEPFADALGTTTRPVSEAGTAVRSAAESATAAQESITPVVESGVEAFVTQIAAADSAIEAFAKKVAEGRVELTKQGDTPDPKLKVAVPAAEAKLKIMVAQAAALRQQAQGLQTGSTNVKNAADAMVTFLVAPEPS